MPLLYSYHHKSNSIMKKYLLIFSLFISTLASSQNLSFSNVFQAEGKSSQEIYAAVKLWSATAFAEAKAATQVDDSENCLISFSSNIQYQYGSISMAAYDGWINFTLTIQCRDGRYKVEMSNINHENKPTATKSCRLGVIAADENSYKSFNKKVASDIKIKTAALYDSICGNIEKSVTTNQSEEDW